MRYNKIRQILSGKTVGIAGCGGLGSNCAVALARTGVGKIVLADYDEVSEANLNRQYFFTNQVGEKKAYALQKNLFRINPEIMVIAKDLKLDANNIPEVFAHCDVIVEAFDLAEMKQMILETVLSQMPSTPIVAGVGVAGYGNNDSFRTEHHGQLSVCGDFTSEVDDENPPLAPRVAIVANMQANVVLEILLSGAAQTSI